MKKVILFFTLLTITINSLTAQWQSTDGIYGADIRCTVVSGTSIFIGTTRGLYQSVDNGKTWVGANDGLSKIPVYALAISGTNIFAGTYGGVYLSTNNGGNWTELNSGLTDTNVSSLIINGTNIFVGTFGGKLFLSTNNANSWTAINDNLTTKSITELFINDNTMFVGTNIGVFKRSLNTFRVGIKDASSDEFNCTIYPNPVSNVLNINCSNALIGRKYIVQNILGEAIMSNILEQSLTLLPVKELSSGIYFLKLINSEKTIKFIKQ